MIPVASKDESPLSGEEEREERMDYSEELFEFWTPLQTS